MRLEALFTGGLAKAGLFHFRRPGWFPCMACSGRAMTWELLVTAKSKAAQIKALARRHTRAAIKVLAAIMNQSDGPATARVSAAQALLDRGWGKAAQPVAGEEGGLAVIARIERVIVDPSPKNNDQTETNSGSETDLTQS
jgi:hypothetical protein